jgi:hypothetical protein
VAADEAVLNFAHKKKKSKKSKIPNYPPSVITQTVMDYYWSSLETAALRILLVWIP